MDPCKTKSWERLLGAYLDGELPAERAREVEAHLSTCARCQKEARLLRLMTSAISQLPQWEPPPDLAPAVLARTVGAPRPLSLRLYRLEPMLRLGMAALTILAAVTGLVLSRLPQTLFSPLSTLARTILSYGLGALREAGELLSPLAKLDVLATVVDTLFGAARTVVSAPPPELVITLLMAFLFFLLVGARFLALRTERRLDHVNLCL